MRGIYGLLNVALLLLAPSFTVAAHEPFCVNDYGNLQRAVVEGCTTFTAERIKAALLTDPEVLMASHPAALLAKYRDTLREKVLAGYRHAGFPDAEVTVGVDEQAETMMITVREGRRYLSGEIRVTGSKSIAARVLTEPLTSLSPPEGARLDGVYEQDGKTIGRWVETDGSAVELQQPLWQAGKAAPFDQTTLAAMERKLKRTLADLGHFHCVLSLRVAPQDDGKTAALLIDVVGKSPRISRMDVRVTGNKINSCQEILEYLQLEPVMPLAACRESGGDPAVFACGADVNATIGISLPERLQYRLWRSGRFIKSEVALEEPASGSDQATLRIEVVESPWAPRLSEPLSPEHVVLLKLRDQLSDVRRWPGDMVGTLNLSRSRIEIVVSPTGGLLASMKQSTDSSESLPLPAEAVFVLGNNRIGLFFPGSSGTKICGSPRIRPVASLGLELDPETNGRDRPVHMMLGFGVKSLGREEDARACILQVNASPGYFLALPDAHEGVECMLEKGVFTLKWEQERWRIDAATGRLVDYIVPGTKEGEPVVRVCFQHGAFQERVEEIETLSKEWPNAYDRNAPLSSLLAFIFPKRSTASSDQANPKELRREHVLRKLLEMQVLEPLDKLVFPVSGQGERTRLDQEDRFLIPWYATTTADPDSLRSHIDMVLVGLWLCDGLLPRHSWPWTVSREMIFMSVNKTQYTEAELQRLLASDETGPIFCVTMAIGLAMQNPRAAKPFAADGLRKLATADFRRDCQVFLDPHCALGQCLLRIAEAVRRLDPAEVKALLGDQSSAKAPLLAECVRALRAQPDRPAADVLLDVLTTAWEAGLRDRVKAMLEAIRDYKIPGPTGLASVADLP
jgi:hypothetical protein